MLSDLLNWGRRSKADPADIAPPKGSELTVPSKAFPKFLAALKNQPEPSIVIDFGPVIGSNVAFLGERLSCKLFIEDLITEIDRHKKAPAGGALAATLEARLRQEDGSVDGVLCWDVFDFLDKASAQTVAKHIIRMLRPGGAVMGFFCTAPVERAPFTKYEIVDDQSLRHRHHPGIGGPKVPMPNRDIIRMFEGLVVAESFLLKNSTREILLRKR
ncbi:MAG TPA: class I SAM-dependent methyltransferase [Vicinamibacterales bacterium]|nr:class I SAM-dependent methyltransferase [Vicinamibacterales bacterium]